MKRLIYVLFIIPFIIPSCESHKNPFLDWVGDWTTSNEGYLISIEMVDGYPEATDFVVLWKDNTEWNTAKNKFRNDVLTFTAFVNYSDGSQVKYDNSLYLINPTEITWDYIKYTEANINGVIKSYSDDGTNTLNKIE